jgi:hypothetical protein
MVDSFDERLVLIISAKAFGAASPDRPLIRPGSGQYIVSGMRSEVRENRERRLLAPRGVHDAHPRRDGGTEPKKVKTITRHPTDARWGDAEPYGSMLDQPVEVRAQATRMRSNAGPIGARPVDIARRLGIGRQASIAAEIRSASLRHVSVGRGRGDAADVTAHPPDSTRR